MDKVRRLLDTGNPALENAALALAGFLAGYAARGRYPELEWAVGALLGY